MICHFENFESQYYNNRYRMKNLRTDLCIYGYCKVPLTRMKEVEIEDMFPELFSHSLFFTPLRRCATQLCSGLFCVVCHIPDKAGGTWNQTSYII